MKLIDVLNNFNIKPHKIEYYEEAFTHSSYANEVKNGVVDYERIEFIGDGVLDLIVADFVLLTDLFSKAILFVVDLFLTILFSTFVAFDETCFLAVTVTVFTTGNEGLGTGCAVWAD